MDSPYFKIVSIYICILAMAARMAAAPQQGSFISGTLMNSGPATLDAAAAPILLTGRVTLEDGAAPSEPVLMELVCKNAPYPGGYTDSKGRFSIELGREQGVLPNASMSSSMGFNGAPMGNLAAPGRESQLRSCDLRASLPGFRSDVVYLYNHRAMDSPELGTLILHRLANVEGFTISATSMLAPPNARKAFEKGQEDVKKKKLAEAQKSFEKATAIYPKYALAWFELGMVYEQESHAEMARTAYASALAADPKYVNPYLRMCVIAYQQGNWQDLADSSSRVVHLNPYDFSAAHYLNAIANLELNNLAVAEKSVREGIRLDTDHRLPKAPYLLGVILVRQRRFAEAAESMRVYLAGLSGAAQSDPVRKQIAEIERLAQETALPVIPQRGVQAAAQQATTPPATTQAESK